MSGAANGWTTVGDNKPQRRKPVAKRTPVSAPANATKLQASLYRHLATKYPQRCSCEDMLTMLLDDGLVASIEDVWAAIDSAPLKNDVKKIDRKNIYRLRTKD